MNLLDYNSNHYLEVVALVDEDKKPVELCYVSIQPASKDMQYDGYCYQDRNGNWRATELKEDKGLKNLETFIIYPFSSVFGVTK